MPKQFRLYSREALWLASEQEGSGLDSRFGLSVWNKHVSWFSLDPKSLGSKHGWTFRWGTADAAADFQHWQKTLSATV